MRNLNYGSIDFDEVLEGDNVALRIDNPANMFIGAMYENRASDLTIEIVLAPKRNRCSSFAFCCSLVGTLCRPPPMVNMHKRTLTLL